MQGWSFLQNTILVMPKTTIGGGDEGMRGSVSAKSTPRNDQPGRWPS